MRIGGIFLAAACLTLFGAVFLPARTYAAETAPGPAASLYQRYIAGLTDETAAVDAVEFFVREEIEAGKWVPGTEVAEQEPVEAGPFTARLWEQVSVSDIGTLTRMATLAGRYERAMDALRGAPPTLQIVIAERCSKERSTDEMPAQRRG